MTEDGFWSIIAASGSHPVSQDARNEAIKGHLDRLDAESRARFGLIYDKLDRAAYRWDLWGAAYVINGGCSEDGFDYFRAWLISRGQAAYEAALDNPDSLAGHLGEDEDDDGDGYENEDFLHLAREALGDAGLEPFPADPAGESWDFDDDGEMARRYPRLTGRGSPERVFVRETLPYYSSLGYRIAADADEIGRLLEAAAAVSQDYPAATGEALLDSGKYHRLWQNFAREEFEPVLECGREPGMTAFIRESPAGKLTKAWAVDRENPNHPGSFPLVFESPHFLLGHAPAANQPGPLSLTMLATRCFVFASAEELAADPRTAGWPVPEFAPTGLFDDRGNESPRPNSSAFLTGTVLEAVKADNPLCSARFWALRVRIKYGEAWVCLPIEALDRDPTHRVIAAAGRMSGSFPDAIPAPSDPGEGDRGIEKGFDNQAMEARIRELTLAFMRTEEFSPMFAEIHPGKLEQRLLKGIGLFNRNFREVGKHFAERRQLGTPELRQRYVRMAETAPIVFAHIVMANTAAIEKGTGSPALVVLAWGDQALEVMAKARDKLGMVHFDMHENQRERELAALIEDEDYHFGRRRPLPRWLVGDQEAYAADLWISDAALDRERLRREVVICFAERGPEGLTMAIPGRFIKQALDELKPKSGPPPLPRSGGPPPLPGTSAPPPLPPRV